MSIRAIIFDLDGTLIDSAPDIAAAVNRYFASAGYEEMVPDFVEQFIGNGPRRLLLDLFAHNGHPRDDAALDAAHRAYLENYRRAPAAHTRFFPHVRADLEALKAAGFRLGVCTNKPHEMTGLVLAELEIAPLFDAVIGADAAPACKPDPRHLLAVAEEMRLSPGEWVYVGDTAVDQKTATGAGAPFFAVPWGGGPALSLPEGARLSRLADLITLCADLAEGRI